MHAVAFLPDDLRFCKDYLLELSFNYFGDRLVCAVSDNSLRIYESKHNFVEKALSDAHLRLSSTFGAGVGRHRFAGGSIMLAEPPSDEMVSYYDLASAERDVERGKSVPSQVMNYLNKRKDINNAASNSKDYGHLGLSFFSHDMFQPFLSVFQAISSPITSRDRLGAAMMKWEHAGRIDYAHSSAIKRIDWAHPEYGQVFATCSSDGTVAIWRERRTMKRYIEAGADSTGSLAAIYKHNRNNMDGSTPYINVTKNLDRSTKYSSVSPQQTKQVPGSPVNTSTTMRAADIGYPSDLHGAAIGTLHNDDVKYPTDKFQNDGNDQFSQKNHEEVLFGLKSQKKKSRLEDFYFSPWVLVCRHYEADSPLINLSFAPPQYGLMLATSNDDGYIYCYRALNTLSLSSWLVEPIYVPDESSSCACRALAWALNSEHIPILFAGFDDGTVKIFGRIHTDSWLLLQSTEITPGNPITDIAVIISVRNKNSELIAISCLESHFAIYSWFMNSGVLEDIQNGEYKNENYDSEPNIKKANATAMNDAYAGNNDINAHQDNSQVGFPDIGIMRLEAPLLEARNIQRISVSRNGPWIAAATDDGMVSVYRVSCSSGLTYSVGLEISIIAHLSGVMPMPVSTDDIHVIKNSTAPRLYNELSKGFEDVTADAAMFQG